MPPKKKGGKKKKEIVPITDPEMLRVLGVPLEGTQLNLRVFYRELGHPISVALKLTDLSCVHDMVREFNMLTNPPPGTNYIFVGKLRKSHLSTIMLQFDGGKNLKDHLGVEHLDQLTFIEADDRMIKIYTRKRMQKTLDKYLSERTEQTGQLLEEKKKPNPSADDLAALEQVINDMTKKIHDYRKYVENPDLALQKFGTFRLESDSAENDPNANVPRTRKKFGSFSVEEQQRLKNLVTEGLQIKRTNYEIAEKEREKAAGKGKKGGKKKKKK